MLIIISSVPVREIPFRSNQEKIEWARLDICTLCRYINTLIVRDFRNNL